MKHAMLVASVFVVGFASPALGVRTGPLASALRAGVGSQSEAFQKARAEARTDLVHRLLAHATWCNEKELFASRDEAWRHVIALDVDNADARKGLRFGRSVDGQWKEPAPRPAKDRNPTAAAELPARRVEVFTPFRDKLLELLETEKADEALRRGVYDEILALEPDDEKVRGLLGEVKVGERWVLPETKKTAERREEIRGLVQKALASSPKPTTDEASPEEAALVPAWKVALKNPTLRVLGTGEAAECEKIAQNCDAASGLFTALFAEPAKMPAGFTVYFVASPAEKDPFIDKMQNANAEARALLKKLIGGGIPGTFHVGLWGGDAKKRLDLALRNSVGHLVRESWGVGPQHGWIWEGLGVYFTNAIAGTHITLFIPAAAAGEDPGISALRKQLASADWIEEARKLFDKGSAPQLADVLKRDVNTMGPRDLIVSHALVAYLVEGRPAEAADVFRRAGKGAGESSAAALEAGLGIKLPDLEKRLRRWLQETAAPKATDTKPAAGTNGKG
jgi:hypothetical protein